MKYPTLWALLGFLLICSGCASIDFGTGGQSEAAKSELLIEKAEHAYTAGNLDESQKLYQEVQAMSPNNGQVSYRLGTIAFRKGEPEIAAKHFEEVVKLNPRDSKAHYNLATIRLMQAENHFKYFVATVDPKADVSQLTILMGAIEQFANSNKNK